jgi:PBP1b-binding outer membrane lipoprotein LpoB
MKHAYALILVVLIAAVVISGCVQSPSGGTGAITQEQKESQAFSAVDQEIQSSVDNATLQDIESQLLQQG